MVRKITRDKCTHNTSGNQVLKISNFNKRLRCNDWQRNDCSLEIHEPQWFTTPYDPRAPNLLLWQETVKGTRKKKVDGNCEAQRIYMDFSDGFQASYWFDRYCTHAPTKEKKQNNFLSKEAQAMGCHIRLPFAPGRNSPKSAEISQTHSCHPATFSHTNPLSEIWTATTFYIWMLQTSNLAACLFFSCSFQFWYSQVPGLKFLGG